MRRSWFVLVAAPLVLALAACRPTVQEVAEGDDALAALAVRAESTRYNGPFWAHEAHRGSGLWTRAKSFCLAHREEDLPNCQPIALVMRWEQPPALPQLVPPSWSTNERSFVAGDVEALKRLEKEVLEKNRQAVQGGAR
jgi:hypothetical protein